MIPYEVLKLSLIDWVMHSSLNVTINKMQYLLYYIVLVLFILLGIEV